MAVICRYREAARLRPRVAASFVSRVSTRAWKLTHAAASPFHRTNAALVCAVVFGHRLNAYAPLRTRSRLLWRFVQIGRVTVS